MLKNECKPGFNHFKELLGSQWWLGQIRLDEGIRQVLETIREVKMLVMTPGHDVIIIAHFGKKLVWNTRCAVVLDEFGRSNS